MTIFERRFKAYFTKNKELIKQPEIIICIGNEGMDLDSFVSSLIIGFAENVIHVINMRKEVFLAKGELMHVCKEFELDPDDFIYLERPLINVENEIKQVGTYFLVDEEQIPLTSKKVSLYLSDHNEPVVELKNCEVSLVIDHHRLESNVEKAKRIYIDVDVGSATKVVAKYLGKDLSRKNHCIKDPKNTDPEKETLCVSIAKLLLVPIVMDTKHLKRRASMFDYYEFKRLKKRAGIKNKELKRLRKVLSKDRRNDYLLPTEIILQKDYKMYVQDNTRFGIVSVKYKFEKWADRDGKKIEAFKPDQTGMVLYMELNEFRKKLGLDFFIVGCKMNGKRGFIFINFPLIDKFALELGFVKVDYKGLEYFNAPVEISRKLLAPKIREYLVKMALK